MDLESRHSVRPSQPQPVLDLVLYNHPHKNPVAGRQVQTQIKPKPRRRRTADGHSKYSTIHLVIEGQKQETQRHLVAWKARQTIEGRASTWRVWEGVAVLVVGESLEQETVYARPNGESSWLIG